MTSAFSKVYCKRKTECMKTNGVSGDGWSTKQVCNERYPPRKKTDKSQASLESGHF